MSDLGDKIKSERLNKSLKQKQLAERAGISISYMSDIERGRTNPSIQTLKKISDALNIKASELID